MESWSLNGEPAVWLGSNEKEWQLRLREKVQLADGPIPARFELGFRVRSLVRNGNRFDLDNMVVPVFQALFRGRSPLHRGALTSWHATRVVDDEPGLALRAKADGAGSSELMPGLLVLDATIHGALPTDSRDGGAHFVHAITEVLGPWLPAQEHEFAVELDFGADLPDISRVEDPPIKPVVDCLFPLFGGTPGAPLDWKVQSLGVRRGVPGLRGACGVRAWLRSTGSRDSLQAAERRNITAGQGLPRIAARTSIQNTGAAHIDMLEAAMQALGDTSNGHSVSQVLGRAAAMFPEMAHVTAESASATMDYHTINVRGRASRPGDFCTEDRWNQRPTFLKVRRGAWRVLTEHERKVFHALWTQRIAGLRISGHREHPDRSIVNSHPVAS